MELLIPGLILVALMAWASTKIKKSAADAFEAETIETDSYTLQKPEGFLHVLNDPGHEFYAYSKEYGAGPNSTVRRATIEIDIFRSESLADIRNAIKSSAADAEVVRDTSSECELETEETANETSIRCFYRVVGSQSAVYRLRFAALAEHVDEYVDRINATLDSFSVRSY